MSTPALPVPLGDGILYDIPTVVAPLLVSVGELRVWAREPEIADDDAFANEILYAASEAVRAAARQPTWDIATAPPRARQICAHLAARSFLNPDSIQREGNLGPVGGDSRVEEMSVALQLTERETAELEGMRPTGSNGRGLWVQPVMSGVNGTVRDVYLPDDSGSDWMIPYLHPDDLPALG